ncbi:MAG: sulfatase-like hydrolase/transferase [Clostridia bacterium]|nr:sulfatase-like hydrolase/transferase [Clostridia bacterium]
MAVSKKVNHGKKRKKRSEHQINEIKAKRRAKKIALFVKVFLHVLFGLIFLCGAVVLSVAGWYKKTFDISFNDLLYTMLSPIEGTGDSTLAQIFSACTPPVVILVGLYVTAAILLWKPTSKRRVMRIIGAVLTVVFLLSSLIYAVYAFKIPEYLENTLSSSEIYETEYVDPDTVRITDKNGNARNLIYIYLESMETTYASVADGGNQPEINYMPKLTELASSNLSFSDSNGLGGFRSITGTGWTMGSLMGTTSGVPFSLAVFGEGSNNSQGKDGTFVNGLTTLGDILAEKGYVQEFLCGSDVAFGGRKTYFTVHGNYKLFDLYTAREEGYIAPDYKVWWGFEDEILFRIAKDEITELASGDKPFNFTMLTVDPHHVGGYICNLCGDEYEQTTANVISCQDRQVAAFIDWCKEQDFYENTTIVIVGDHPRMDTRLIGKELEIYDRTMYNCIINSVVEPYSKTTNRTFTSLDMFPTTLAAMGFEIEGERLGLGTNLFSPVPTLCEKNGGGRVGYDWLDAEVSKSSDYYKDNFVGKKD